MSEPNIIIDIHSRYWQYDKFIDKYQCITIPSLMTQSLEDLEKGCGPLHFAVKGPEVKVKKAKPAGTVVKFDCPMPVTGKVLSSTTSNGRVTYTIEAVVAEEWVL